MASEEAIQQAINAAISGDKSSARKILNFVIESEPNNARAWYFLSQVMEKPEQAIYCLKQVLRIHPQSQQAKERLEQLTTEINLVKTQQPQDNQDPQAIHESTYQQTPNEIESGEKRNLPVGIVYSMKGIGDLLEVYDDKVAITPFGFWGLVTKGVKGTKTIPFASITAIQFKKSGLTSGYLQFSLPGGIEGARGVFQAATDENTFMFAGQNELALEIKNYIEKRILELRKPQVAQTSTSLADELNKLVKLKEQGILSEEEFLIAKRKLLD